jgi:hypothetical protein
MAMHYYDEENVKPGDKLTNGQVIVNHHMELTDEEVAEIKKQAKDKMIAKEISRLEKKPEKTDFKKEENKQEETLF